MLKLLMKKLPVDDFRMKILGWKTLLMLLFVSPVLRLNLFASHFAMSSSSYGKV